MIATLECTKRRVRSFPGCSEPVVRPEGAPHRVIQESSRIGLSFNVMPDRPVAETLYIREYRVWPRYIEATFDRTYHSAMLNSPSHLIFLAAAVHLQKITYVYMCYELGLEYDPLGPEVMKFWPTKLDIRLPALVAQETDIVQRVKVTDLRWFGDTKFKINLTSVAGEHVKIDVESPGFVADGTQKRSLHHVAN